MKETGTLRKMPALITETSIQYDSPIADSNERMNSFIGGTFNIAFTGNIFCTNCGRKTKKSFGQGLCFPCFRDSPANSPCIIRPELCEGHAGKGRDPEWEQKHHVQPHVVYLALTSAPKVGVTRSTQIPTRWIDQGAWKTIRLAETNNRHEAGLIEVALKEHISDKTHWQGMLKNISDEQTDLVDLKEELAAYIPDPLQQFFSENDEVATLSYPVLEYPVKVKSINLDKTPSFSFPLIGIRGQYLIFENGLVMNVRKFSGYEVTLELTAK